MKTASLFMLVALVAFPLSLLPPLFLSQSVSYAFENESLRNDHFRGKMRKRNVSFSCYACLIPVDDQEQPVRMDGALRKGRPAWRSVSDSISHDLQGERQGVGRLVQR